MDSQTSRPKPVVACDKCGEKFLRTLLKKHYKSCQREDNSGPFKCPAPECSHRTFKTRGIRKKHIKVVHHPPIKCPIAGCDAVIKEVYLKQHLKGVHEKIKEECPNCGKSLSYASSKQHLEICTSDGSRLFECTVEGCKSTFKTAHSRSVHIYSVHNEPVQCPVPNCTAMVKNAGLLKHVKQVHEKLKENCGNCGKELSYGNLNRHLMKCKGSKARL